MNGPINRMGEAWRGMLAGWRGTAGPISHAHNVDPINWTVSGGIPTHWPTNWWQQGLNPIRGGESATVNACINSYAQTIAQLPGRHMRERPGGGADPVTTSALSRILRFPNAYQTRSDFVVNLVTQLLQTGNAYAWARRNDRQEVESLHLMPARGVEPWVDPDTGTIFYALSENWLAGQATPPDYLVPARDVLHVRVRTHPARPLQGISPISWAAMAIASNTAISATQAHFFNNASQPSGFLSTKEKLDAVQMAALRAAWEDRAAGVAAGYVPILGGGLEFQQLGITSQDSQLVEAFGMSVADIARAFGVPLPIIGDLQNATFNNVENLIGLWLSQGLGFYVEHIETALDKFFALPATEYVELDTDVLMRTAFKDRIEGLAKAIQGGLYSPDEARAREGLPPAPDGFGKEPRLQAQVVPLSAAGQPAQSAPTPPAPANDEATKLAKLETRLALNSGFMVQKAGVNLDDQLGDAKE